jgi:hypothetical protein
MHRLLAEENDHKRRAEEFRVKAARPERRAVALRIQVEEVEAQLERVDAVDPG